MPQRGISSVAAKTDGDRRTESKYYSLNNNDNEY